MYIRLCNKCCVELPATIEYFHKQRRGKFGLKAVCKKCCRKWQLSYNGKKAIEKYLKSKKCKETHKKYYEKNKDKILERTRNYYKSERGIETRRNYRKSAKYKNYQKKFLKSEKGIEIKRLIDRKRYRNNKLSRCMSSAIRKSIKKNKSGYHWEELVDYNLNDLVLHLQGTIGLTKKVKLNNFWEYFYGKYYHIDHIRPVSSFDKVKLQDVNSTEFKECWSLKNLQLLTAIDNMKKGVKYEL